MKSLNYLAITLLISLIFACNSDKKPTETEEKSESSTEEFSDLANEDGFAEMHDEPLEVAVDAIGKMMQIEIEGTEPANIYSIEKENSSNYLIVIHEWWGLNNQIIAEADRLYGGLGNTNVIALDLYDGKLATTREKATEYMQGVDEVRINSIIKSVLETLPQDAEVATIGWCFGGGWSLKTAILAEEKTAGCVMYYGMPIKDSGKLENLHSDVLFIYGTKDEWINTEVAEEFEKNMSAADKNVTVLAFEADHAFANPSSERYLESAAQEANKKALQYLSERLK